MNIAKKEKVTQKRVINLFCQQLDYNYLGNWQDRANNSNLEPEILSQYLKENGYSEILIKNAIDTLKKAATQQNKSLYDINQEIYSLLRYGVKVKADISQNTQTVWLINWDNPLKNHFAIAEEVTIKGEN